MNILDLVFPKFCINCKKWGSYLCVNCELGLWEEEQICPICARPSRYGLPHTYCHQRYALDGLTCIWAYEGIARKIITRAKYNFYFDLLRELFNRAGDIWDRPEYSYWLRFLKNNPVVVPVPLHTTRLQERGFNQAEVIGRLVAKSHRLSFNSHWLFKVRDTGHQVGRTRQERLAALEGAFQISKSKVQIPPAVLLVDDVWTTGSTLSECAKVLKKSGVKSVWGLVLAR